MQTRRAGKLARGGSKPPTSSGCPARETAPVQPPQQRPASWVQLAAERPWLLCLVCSVLAQTGCSWTDAHGTHHLIVGLGFGVVTTTNRPGVDVYDARVLGAMAGPDGAGVGWMQQHRVAIDPALASNVVVSIKATPGSVTVKSFDPYAHGTNTSDHATTERNANK